MLKEQHQLFDVGRIEPVIEAVERMRDGVRELLRREVALQLVDILPHRLDFPMLALIESPNEHVHLAPVLGKARPNLFAEKDAGAIRDFEAAIDPIVIGERHAIHPALAQLIVERARLGIALRQSDATEQPFRCAVTVAGVEMEIGFQKLRIGGLRLMASRGHRWVGPRSVVFDCGAERHSKVNVRTR